MTQQTRTHDGRYAHVPTHAGFDRDGREWEGCDHCGQARPLGESRWRANIPELIPNRLWTEDERKHRYYEVTGTTDEGTIVLLHLDGHPLVAFDRRQFALLAESRGWPDGIRGRVRVEDGALIYEDEEELS